MKQFNISLKVELESYNPNRTYFSSTTKYSDDENFQEDLKYWLVDEHEKNPEVIKIIRVRCSFPYDNSEITNTFQNSNPEGLYFTVSRFIAQFESDTRLKLCNDALDSFNTIKKICKSLDCSECPFYGQNQECKLLGAEPVYWDFFE